MSFVPGTATMSVSSPSSATDWFVFLDVCPICCKNPSARWASTQETQLRASYNWRRSWAEGFLFLSSSIWYIYSIYMYDVCVCIQLMLARSGIAAWPSVAWLGERVWKPLWNNSTTLTGTHLLSLQLLISLYNRELAEFLAFLGEEEAALERLEGGEVSETQLEKRKESVRARDGQFCSLASRGKEQVGFRQTIVYNLFQNISGGSSWGNWYCSGKQGFFSNFLCSVCNF